MKFRICFISILFVFLTSGNVQAAEAIADVSLTPAGDFKAKTQDVTGFATVKDNVVSAKNIVVNLKTITTGISLRDKHAREKYMEVGKHPTMVLLNGEGKGGVGKGRIKWRGVEKDIQGQYTIEGKNVQAKFSLKLSDFAIKNIKYMGVGVDDEVKISVTVPIKK